MFSCPGRIGKLKEFVKTFSVDAESEIYASLQPDLTPFILKGS